MELETSHVIGVLAHSVASNAVTRVHFAAVLPLLLYGQLPQWPRIGAEGRLLALQRLLVFLNQYFTVD